MSSWFALLFFFFNFGISQFSFAQTEATTAAETPVPKEIAEEVQAQQEKEEDLSTKVVDAKNRVVGAYRQAGAMAEISRTVNETTLLLSYSSFDLVLPSKMGATIAWHSEGNKIYELEYLSSSISAPYVVSDLASMSEQRISILKRNFSSAGTFNWFWGVAHNTSKVHVSQQLMSNVNSPNGSDMMNVQTLGLSIGLGNRWVIKENFSIGVDWFSWSQPLIVLKKEAAYLDNATDEGDREKANTILDIIGYFPRWAAFKVQVGYSF